MKRSAGISNTRHLDDIIEALRGIAQSARQIVIFRRILQDPVISAMLELLDLLTYDRPRSEKNTRKATQAYASFFSSLAVATEFDSESQVGTPWQNHILNKLLSDENPFSRKAEMTELESMGGSLIRQVQSDLLRIHRLFLLETSKVLRVLEQVSSDAEWIPWDDLNSQPTDQNRRPSKKLELKQRLHETPRWDGMIGSLANYYAEAGVGIFGEFKAFHWRRGASGGVLDGISAPDPIRLEDLIGCESQKDWLVRNTDHFVAGHPANNVLVYGDRGTGKSSVIKGLIHAFDHRSLRMLEMSREDLADLPEVMKLLRSRREKFIVFIDDLSFEEGETQYKTLKAILEGSLEARPANVLIYATSNRRHLIREYFSDRDPSANEEIRHQDTVQEKISLADRFGIQLIFLAPDQMQYLEIVESMAQRRGLRIPKETLHQKALHWAQLFNGRSGRTARQFIDHLVGRVDG